MHMIARSTPPINPAPRLHLLAVGKIANGTREIRVAPRPANPDIVLAAMSWGRQLFHDGASRIACRNQHEEAGFDEAAAELEAVIDEMHAKPGLDYAVVNADDRDAEPSWAAFLVHAQEEDDRSDAYAAGRTDYRNCLPSDAHSYPDAAQQTAYANGYFEAQVSGAAYDTPSDYADDCDEIDWIRRGC